MSHYIIELEDEESTTILDAFDGERELTRALDWLLKDAHYSGTGWLIKSIWRWGGGGQLTELELKRIKEDRSADGDWLYWEYELTPKAPAMGSREAYFVIRIDGRA